MFSTLGFLPSLVWLKDDGEFRYCNHPFIGRVCNNAPGGDWQWFETGDIVEVEWLGCWYYLQPCGVATMFESLKEAKDYAVLYELKNGNHDAN